jgi:DNA-binding IclR family transcriptional regulator
MITDKNDSSRGKKAASEVEVDGRQLSRSNARPRPDIRLATKTQRLSAGGATVENSSTEKSSDDWDPQIESSLSEAMRDTTVPAVIRAIAILRLLSHSGMPQGVNQISRKLGIIPSTGLHILRALANEGLVTFNPSTKHYSLGLELVNLARAALRGSIAEVATPYLKELVNVHSVTAVAVGLSGDNYFVVVALAHSRNAIRLQTDLGSRFPKLISATGRCLAAYSSMSDRQLQAKFKPLRWYSAPTFAEWKREVDSVRELGYAVDDGSFLQGVTIVAAPILSDSGECEHAITAFGIREHLQGKNLDRVTADVRRCAMEISKVTQSSSRKRS